MRSINILTGVLILFVEIAWRLANDFQQIFDRFILGLAKTPIVSSFAIRRTVKRFVIDGDPVEAAIWDRGIDKLGPDADAVSLVNCHARYSPPAQSHSITRIFWLRSDGLLSSTVQ